MLYPTITLCIEQLFPYIRARMAHDEPAPYYEGERSGIDHLDSIFQLMKRNEYEGVLGKAAYLFCSIIDGHHFSNGNKRLAVTLMSFFLLSNNLMIHAPNMQAIKEELKRTFPKLKWEEVKAFRFPHEFFFYHLAIIIADRTQKGKMTFSQEQEAVKQLLSAITVHT